MLLFYSRWEDAWLAGPLSLALVAGVHWTAALALMVFMIAHIYMAATTGTPWYAYLRTMVTGYQREERKPPPA